MTSISGGNWIISSDLIKHKDLNTALVHMTILEYAGKQSSAAILGRASTINKNPSVC